MASAKNDAMNERTVEGLLNYYDGDRLGTAADKGLASRLGGHTYNIINNQAKDEIYFRNLRSGDHFLDEKGRHTIHFAGDRKRKFRRDERNLMAGCFQAPADHPRQDLMAQRRTELQLAQMENFGSWNGFQDRCKSSLAPAPPPKRHTISNKKYANEAEKLKPRMSNKEEWATRRGETMVRSISAPSLDLADPHGSMERAVRGDIRKEVSQRLTESAHFAPRIAGHTYANSMESTEQGRKLSASQQYCSINRLENHDFAVARKNNHYSSQDKLTRADPFYMRPRLAMTNSSVKYDILSNERRWFKYS